MPGEIVLLTGNAHPKLAQAIAHDLRVHMVKAEVGCFSNGETHVSIDESVRYFFWFFASTSLQRL
jgi:ribose-phosphate pyrophosphokinase